MNARLLVVQSTPLSETSTAREYTSYTRAQGMFPSVSAFGGDQHCIQLADLTVAFTIIASSPPNWHFGSVAITKPESQETGA